MNLDDLEEALEDVLPAGFHIERDSHGQLVIMTGLCQDEDGELVDYVHDEDEEDEDYDPDFESLDEEFDDDE